jgi:hypothetical protein
VYKEWFGNCSSGDVQGVPVLASLICTETGNKLEHKGKGKGHPITCHEGPRGGIEV